MVQVPQKVGTDKILQALPKIFKKAEESRLEGDDEQYYVLYMKFMELFQVL